ncbi:hypothetical protein BGW41_001002 [Actinomortierella wolfii]|nr:hypothetical protein BGW41_001002 [Actinomortierella wolfii]
MANSRVPHSPYRARGSYLSPEDLDDRFTQLNAIVKKYYPTAWGNLIALVAITTIFTLCSLFFGIVRTVQGSCFVIPITLVLWARIRKEVRDRAIKKLLRAWTAEDSNNYAVQWKLRLRTVTRVEFTRVSTNETIPVDITDITSGLEGTDRRQSQQGEVEQRQGQPVQGRNSRQGQEQEHDVITIDDRVIVAETRVSPTETQVRRARGPSSVFNRWSLPLWRSSSSSSPSDTTNHDILRTQERNGRRQRRHSSIQLFNPSRIEIQNITITAAPTTTTGNVSSSTRDGEGRGGLMSRPAWQEFMDALEDLCCCFTCARSTRRVWMIEISLRECLLDEYALTIPSPVYRDYRLPQYDEIMQTSASVAPNSPSPSSQPVYVGLPPAYESESEIEDDDEDNDDEDDEEHVVTGRTRGGNLQQHQQQQQQQHQLHATPPSSSCLQRQQEQQQIQREAAPLGHDTVHMREVIVTMNNIALSTTAELAAPATVTECTSTSQMDTMMGSIAIASTMEQSHHVAAKVDPLSLPYAQLDTKDDLPINTATQELPKETVSINPPDGSEALDPEKEMDQTEGDGDRGESSRSSL